MHKPFEQMVRQMPAPNLRIAVEERKWKIFMLDCDKKKRIALF
jgi:hypothetical protein